MNGLHLNGYGIYLTPDVDTPIKARIRRPDGTLTEWGGVFRASENQLELQYTFDQLGDWRVEDWWFVDEG